MITAITSTEDLQELLLYDEFDFVQECGFLKPTLQVTINDVAEIVRSVCLEYVIIRSTREMTQFLEGL